jgi:hypothetical protein
VRTSSAVFRKSLWLVCALLVACAGPTPYQRLIEGRGYHEEQLDASRFRVSFFGNARTSPETIENYVLFRAAELTLESKGDYFIVLDQGEGRLATVTPNSLERPQQEYEGEDGAQDPIFETVATGSVRPVVSHQATLVIEVHTGPRPADQLNAFGASELKDRLKPLIQYPEKVRL